MAAAFTALGASHVSVPLVLIAVAGTLTIVRYRTRLKEFDLWALDEWLRTRYDAYGIAEWHRPYHAAELYCRNDIVQARNEAAGRMNSIMMELLKDHTRASALHSDYDDAQARYKQCDRTLGRELLAYLRRGDLFAKGMLSKDGAGKAERIIPTARWRIMDLDISNATASGAGWNYIGIVVGARKTPEQIEL